MNELRSSPPSLGIKKFIPGIAWFFLVLILICLPGSDIPSVNDWLGKIYFDKWVHTGLFAVLAFLFMLPFFRSSLDTRGKWHIIIRIGLATCLWGLATEFIQKFFVTGRQFDWFDWAADSLGALLALLFSRWKLLRFEKSQRA